MHDRPTAPNPAAPAPHARPEPIPATDRHDAVERAASERAFLPAALATDTVEALQAELGPARPWIYRTILGLAAAALLALPLVRVDVTLAAPAQVRAASERADIRAAVSGRIQRLWVTDNTAVAAAEPLLELDAQAVDARLAHNRARQRHARDVLHDLDLLSTAAGGVAVLHHLTTTPAAAETAPVATSADLSVPPSEVLAEAPSASEGIRRPDILLPGESEISNLKSQIPAALPPAPSPAAETGAVAAEVSESSAAGALLGISDLESEISDRDTDPEATHTPPQFRFPVSSLRSSATRLLAEISNLKSEIATGGPAPVASPVAFRTGEIAAEWHEFTARHAGLLLAAARARAELARITTLSDQGLVSRRDRDEARFALARAEAEADILRQQSLARWQVRRRDEELVLIALVSEEAHLGDERTSFTVEAPIAGTVLGLAGLAEGAWVAAGQALGVVSPDDDLLVEAAVPPQRIGFIRRDQPVRLAIDTYAPTTWGTLRGRVLAVSDDLQAAANGSAFYRVLIAPEAIVLRRPDGTLAPLRKGMAAQARFVVARRTLLELLREETSAWLDPRRA